MEQDLASCLEICTRLRGGTKISCTQVGLGQELQLLIVMCEIFI